MALVLGTHIGDRVSVGNDVLTVASVTRRDVVTLRRQDGTSVEIYEDRSVEVLPGVHVFLGVTSGKHPLRLAFEAPAAVAISRLKAI